jgi:dolichyl-diphosphooligosaccharide--protein glycosyltransferase
MPKKILPWLLVFVLILTVIYFRFYPSFLPYLDLAARQEVYNAERATLKKTIEDKYPDMRGLASAKLLDRFFDDMLKTEKPEINAKIAHKAMELKGRYRDPEGKVYLNGIDSYYWLRLLNNLLKSGHIGDRQLAGIEFDDLIGAPIDPATKKNAHLWLGFVFYKASLFFHRDATLQEVLFYIPIFLSCIIAIFSFIIAKKCGCGDLGAFVAAFAINLSPFFLARSTGEWFDTDIYNILFPLLSFGAFLYALASEKLIKRILFTAVSGFFLGCYASTWKGWWFIFDIMVVSCLFFILNQKLSRQEEPSLPAAQTKARLFTLGYFFIFSAFFVILLNGFSVWKDFIAEPLRLSTIMKVTSESMWPNVYQTVAELGQADAHYVTTCLGAPAVFFLSLIGILYIFLVERSVRDERYGFGILCLVFWIISVFYAALEASRFILLLVVPVGLAFGLTVDRFYLKITKDASRYLKKTAALLVRYAVILCLSLYMVSVVLKVHSTLIFTTPQMDDYWYNTLTKIKKDTPKDAYIDSWWDFGHWFKSVAQRRVLFDGMTQNTPYAYWMARALLTEREEESTAILRMINAHDNRAADILEQEEKMDPAAAVGIVNKVLGKDREEARVYLETLRFAPYRVQELLDLIFARQLPPVYFIVSYDMISKVGPISYVGNWDFEKVDMWFKKKKMDSIGFMSYLIDRYNLTRQAAQDKNIAMSMIGEDESKKWFSRPLGFFSGLSDAKQDGSMLFFDNGLVVDLDNGHAYVASEMEGRRGAPQSLVMMENSLLKIIPQKDASLTYSGLIIKKGDKYQGMLMDEEFAKSMLVRLYFFKGEGLKHFKLFHEETDDKGNAIYVYQVIW